MITLNTCQLKQTYFVSQIHGDLETKKHLQNLGFVKNARVALMNRDKSNGVILIHNSRIALDNTILANIDLSKDKYTENSKEYYFFHWKADDYYISICTENSNIQIKNFIVNL